MGDNKIEQEDDDNIKEQDDGDIKEQVYELRSKLLDNQGKTVDWWLRQINVFLTALGVLVGAGGIVVAAWGYFAYKKFDAMETEAKGILEEIRDTRDKSETETEDILEEMRFNRDLIETMTSWFSRPGDRPEFDVKKVDERPQEVQKTTKKLIARADSLEQEEKISEARGIWWSIAISAEERKENDRAAQAWYHVGRLFWGEDPKECISANTKAIDLKPDYIAPYINRGAAKVNLGLYEDAILDFNKAIDRNPNLFEAYYNRGGVKALLGQYADAISDYDVAISLKFGDAQAYYNRSLAYYNRGLTKVKAERIDEARQDFRIAQDLARSAGNHSLADLAEKHLRDLHSQEDE